MKYYFILICILVLTSCNTKTHKQEFTNVYPQNYNASIRWKRFDNLKSFLDKDDYKTIDKIKKKYKNSTINSYRILLIKPMTENKYKVVMEREEVISPSNILRVNRYVQFWVYDLVEKQWKIEQELEDKE